MGYGHFEVLDYSTLSRRQGCLPVSVSRRFSKGENIAVAIDSTGLKVYGEGEWKVRKHGWSKRCIWLKMHIGNDVQTQEIILTSLTGNDVDDASEQPECYLAKPVNSKVSEVMALTMISSFANN